MTFEDGEQPSCCLSGNSVATVQISKGELYNRTGLLIQEKLSTTKLEEEKIIPNKQNKFVLSIEYGNLVVITHQKTDKFLFSSQQKYTCGSHQQIAALVDKKSNHDDLIVWKIKPIEVKKKI